MNPDFAVWLEKQVKPVSRDTIMSQARRLEGAYGDLDQHYEKDGFASIHAELRYTSQDRAQGRPNPSRVSIDVGDPSQALQNLRTALRYYSNFRKSLAEPASETKLWPALEEMRSIFLDRCPDFEDFGRDFGTYFESERDYKQKLIERAHVVMADAALSELQLGEKFLEILWDSNFVGWRAFRQIEDAGQDAKAEVATALGKMVRDRQHSVPSIVATAAEAIHPLVSKGAGGPAYGQVRTLVTAALALARPDEAISVKTQFMQRAARALTGAPIFSGLLTEQQYNSFLELSQRIRRSLIGWDWQPRDLWDVQGFLWVSNDSNWKAEPRSTDTQPEGDSDEVPVPDISHPLNLILYGPPGTGKTWSTATRAVEICTGRPAPSQRAAVMKLYEELVRGKRIHFTTFHQSIGYEEFVEGLRPVTDSEEEAETSGFRLEPTPGIFRDVCALAEQARKRGGRPGTFDFTGRRFFKMSLGRIASGSEIYDAAIEGNYVVLGWGRDVDWSDPRYEEYQAVFDRWQEIEPGTAGNSGNISQLWRFRSMKTGDIVIVSDGNLRYRAIAEVTGGYEFARGTPGGNHRRAVKWLAVLEESLPVQTIYQDRFVQASCYQLNSAKIKQDVLAEQVTQVQTTDGSPPERYVLIIDEINRANVSKVLGELITLLEPDKRLGALNQLTVRLPYSGQDFGVPGNLHVIGTMNTADRSIALMDTALRRRFEFKAMMPDYTMLREIDGIDIGRVLKGLNGRIEWLFDRDHQIGHGLFTDVDSKSQLDNIMRWKVIPLLEEYFYENLEKVRIVLNDAQQHFIEEETLAPPALLNGEAEGRKRYTVKDGPYPLEAYAGIAQGAE